MSVPAGGTLRIREVWAENLEEEFELIRSIVDDYPYLAMDTEFPGVVVRPVGSFRSSAEYHYQTLRMNVDMLKLIQLGLTFTDSDGLLPTFDDEFEEGGEGEDVEGEEGAVRDGGGGGEGGGKQENGTATTTGAGEAAAADGVEEKGTKKERKKKGTEEKERRVREYCVWQFNFREFSLRDDMYAHDSIELLKQSGIDFARNEAHGVEYARFAELLMSSGVVLNESVHWITFHSGYDFGYLLKLLTGGAPLPPGEAEFFALLRVFFPTLYDIKHLMRFCDNLHGGLNRLAEALDVVRIGPQHQAGSDSLLTSAAFRKLTQHMGNFFSSHPERYQGVLYGLGADGGNSSGNPVTAE